MYAQRKGSTSQWRKIRKAVLERDNYCCYYCGADNANSVDHITSLSKGGTNEFSNLITACTTCNYSKGTKSPEQFQKDRIKKLKKEFNKRFFYEAKTPPTPASEISPICFETPFEKP
jgi:5-methylcytosine-specific restriction endonuclease McrA